MDPDNPLSPPSPRIFLTALTRGILLVGAAYLFRPTAPHEQTGVASTLSMLQACGKDQELFRTHVDRLSLNTLRALRESNETTAARIAARLRAECGGRPAGGDCEALASLDACLKSNEQTLSDVIGRSQGPHARRAR